MSRWKAAAIHLSLSVAVGLLTTALLLLVWYPPPYFHADGGDGLVILLLGVDLTVGPVLTLVVFRSGKPGLKFDLWIIALMQIAALGYGLGIVLESRPVFLVATPDRFKLVYANDLDEKDLAQASVPEFRTMSWSGPRLVGVRMPTDANEANELLSTGLNGKDVEKFPKYYVPYEQHAQRLLARAHPLTKLRAQGGDANRMLDQLASSAHASDEDLVWVPVIARRHDMVMILLRRSGQPIGAVPIDPW